MVRCPYCHAPLAYEGATCGACRARRMLVPDESVTTTSVPEALDSTAKLTPEVHWSDAGLEVVPPPSSPPQPTEAPPTTDIAAEAPSAPPRVFRWGRVLIAVGIVLIAFGALYAWQVLPSLQHATYALRAMRASDQELYERSTSVLASTRSVRRDLRNQGVAVEVETTPGYIYRILYRAPAEVDPDMAELACLDTLAPLIRDWPDTGWTASFYADEERLFRAAYSPRTKQIQTTSAPPPPEESAEASP